MLDSIAQGDPKAAAELLPLVDEELHKLAAHKMAAEAPSQTLQATALVHEAGLSQPQAADLLGISRRTADRTWAYARAAAHRDRHAACRQDLAPRRASPRGFLHVDQDARLAMRSGCNGSL